MIRVFQALTIVLGGIAGYFFWTDNYDGTFVAAVLAAVSFFLSIRFQARARVALRDADREASGDPLS